MEFMEYARRRQAVREFTSEPVSREDLLYCLEAARIAPSAFNSQPWKFIVVDEPVLKEKVCAAIHDPILKMNRFVYGCGALVVVLKDSSSMNLRVRTVFKKYNFSSYDIGMAVENFCLAAVERHLGTCVMGWCRQRRVKDLLFIPDDLDIALLVAVGHPKDGGEPRPKDRKPLENIVCFNTCR